MKIPIVVGILITNIVFIFNYLQWTPGCLTERYGTSSSKNQLLSSAIESNFGLMNITKNGTRYKPVQKVLLVTYYRGGSSFLGELFNQNDKINYWFEPLKVLYNTKAYKNLLGVEELAKISLLTIQHLFSCNTDLVLMDVLQDRHAQVLSNHKQPYKNCLVENGTEHYTYCVQLLTQECKDAEIRVIKTIRIRMAQVRQLLLLDPSIKYIFYPRDPRASLLSASRAEKYFNFTKEAIVRCNEMKSDIKIYNNLKRKYPLNFFSIKYEDLALNPIQGIQLLYTFLHSAIPDNLYRWIEENTNAIQPSTWKLMGTKRNSTYTVNEWKYDITKDQKTPIDNVCHEVLRIYNYTL